MAKSLENNEENRLTFAKCIVESMPASLHIEAIERLRDQWAGNDSLWVSDLDDWAKEFSEFEEEAYDEIYASDIEEGDWWDESTINDYLVGSLETLDESFKEEK